ncbi:uncharacterized protein [Oryza sativa Japonica Group]|uniref:Os08g0448100 protein n=2 Tax=Oryza sativa subsp. japonica TaxID=39947 RepID=Q0J5B5_ORYSJ|nr:uncharacterized protein LOC4345718 [Oryza sativa Japonica Group]EAZ42923.1 hypothetical protein OsJ_27513 [Oryza sativa Japonica Group]KAF2919925.1 hypothetical protein DAI22_08g171500 [Oryza sativa Japonica Group]BAD09443.1 unknown protein [Oryza sativa Japonica Group]BAF23850.1 Os08g0448100 [Oryza sativa Japonica Group]BAT05684.1 Os08g0448100 [Oryza sativa Japonica Group]|eukprot:NP_001061936.1 Os08g0448100 [Oryza sativa Japonica Group]
MASPERRSSTTTTSSLLGSFRTAVKKVRFLLSFSATRWILSSIVGSRAGPRRRVSFGPAARPPSLLDYEGSAIVSPPARSGAPSRTASLGPSPARTVTRTSSAASSELLRTSSAGSSSSSPAGGGGDDDIDRRAELFIANFYKHIQMERQVSLQLRYLDRTPSR